MRELTWNCIGVVDGTRHDQYHWAAPNAAVSPPFASSPSAWSSPAARAVLQVLCLTSGGVARPSARTRLLTIHLNRQRASTSQRAALRPRESRPLVPPQVPVDNVFDGKRGVATCPGAQQEERRHQQALALLVRDGVVRMDRDCAPRPGAVGSVTLLISCPFASSAMRSRPIDTTDTSACEPLGGRGLCALTFAAAPRRRIRDNRRLDLTAIGCGGEGAPLGQSQARGVQWRGSGDRHHLARSGGHHRQAGAGLLGQRYRPERLFRLPLAAELGPCALFVPSTHLAWSAQPHAHAQARGHCAGDQPRPAHHATPGTSVTAA